MRQFLKKIASYDTYSLLRVAAVATAGSALLSNDPDYRDTFSRWNSVLSNESSLSAPWRLNLSNLGSLESNLGSFPINFFLPSQCGGPGSQAPHDDSRHKCQCLGKDSIANAAAKIGPAVVNISVPQGVPGLYMGKSMGSGTIIDPDGTILTCAHVLMDYPGKMGTSNSKVEVTLQDGRIFEGTVLNADLHSDVAIIKIKSRLPLPYAKIGTSSQLRPGDWVIAVGCPLSLQNTVTAGIVSCVDRKSSDLGLGGMRREYLQTDCAINKGNSGGPLVNMDGEVVGLNVMKVLAADGLSFSVPIDSICKIIDHFKKSGRVVRPWIGLKMIDLNEMIIAQLKDKDRSFPNVTKGILVPMVIPGSPGERAGFLPGDVVIEFDHKPVGSIKEVVEILDDKVGVAIKVVVKRKNNVVDLVVIPEEANTNM